MSEKKGFDPFANPAPKTQAGAAGVDEPMDELFAVDEMEAAAGEPVDGWEPIAEETWDPQESAPGLDTLLLEESGIVDAVEPSMAAPSHSNPLPDLTEPAPVVEPERVRPQPPQSTQQRQQFAPDSNEAILQSGRHRVDAREKLPVRSDAPSMPVVQDSRPTAAILPIVVAVAGIGAGVLICMGANPILGGIAISLSLVGSLFLRVMLKQ